MFNNLNQPGFDEVINRVSDAIAVVERPLGSRLMAKFSPIMQHVEYNIVFANTAFCELMGSKQEELCDKPLLSILPYSEKLQDVSDFLKPMNNFESYKTPIYFDGMDGTFEIEVHPYGKDGQRAERKLIILRRVNEALPADLSADPEVLPRPRNIRMSRRMISDLSHEIRTPLNAIIGFSELMQSMAQFESSKESGKNYDYLQDIISSGRELLLTLTSVMELARYEGGHTEQADMQCDLAESVKFVAVDAASRVGAEGMVQVKGFANELPVKIEQMVLERILSWAISFLWRLSEKDCHIYIRPENSQCGRAVVALEIEKPLSARIIAAPKAESSEFTCNDEENSFNLFLARRFLKIFGGYIEVVKDEEKNATGIRLYVPMAEALGLAETEVRVKERA